jgi:uncharacterized surface protein with fasciclin (FAS1) repeats
MKTKLLAGVAFAALLGAVLPAPAPAVTSLSIYDTLALMKDHSVMFVAVTEAKEVGTLKGDGSFTLLAPTDAAFKKLDDATIKKIANEKETVRKLVRAHLIEDKLTAKKLDDLDGKEMPTRHGGSLRVEKLKDGFRVGGVKLVADRVCSNGVIQVIDTVLPVAME